MATSDALPARDVFRGAGVALLTLFDGDGTLLVEQTAQLAAQLVDDGAQAVLVAGTTGEFWTLTARERSDLISAVRQAVPATIPVIGGIGAVDVAQALDLAAAVQRTDADAALCFVPRGADPAELYPKVRDAVGDLPLLAYHFPAVGYADLPVAQLATLPIDGIKDSSGDPPRLTATSRALGAGVYTGSALLVSLAAALEVGGALLALANLDPATAAAAAGGSLPAQRELARLHSAVGGGTPPTALKQAVARRYDIPPWTRGVPLSDVI